MIVSNYPYWPRIFKQIGSLVAVLFALWEARILWGSLVNSSRTIARQAISFANSEDFSRPFVYRQIAFVHAVRCALRNQAPWGEIDPFLDIDEVEKLKDARNVPAAILQDMGEELTGAVRHGILSELQMQRIDQTLTDLCNILGGCERIKNTPLPRQYDFYPELMIKIYCIVLPFVIADEVGLLTPVITLVVSFAFLVLNRIGKNLEDPFENRVYDVPLTALSRSIEINLKQALGERQIAEQVKVVDGVLW